MREERVTEPLATVPVGALPPERFGEVLDPEQYRAFITGAQRGHDLLSGRAVWNVNSTARGGGVAEMLRSLLAYTRGAGVDARWVVIQGDPEFFTVTKRIHNRLHGYAGDGGPLGRAERDAYESTSARNADALSALVRPGDVVILHDPQTVGLCEAMKEAGATLIWRCHVGLDSPNDYARDAWDFLRAHLAAADAYVFSRQAYLWEGLDERKMVVIPPSIDAFSPKNQDLSPEQIQAILACAQVLDDEARSDPVFLREDGSPASVVRRADLSAGAPPPPPDVPLVVQVSRWDRLKDPLGVIQGFVDHVAPYGPAHLIVAGPAVEAVADDPEGAEVLRDAQAAWRDLPEVARERVHLVALPMEDGEENAAIVNALQRRADVVVQKSLAEGFGLTVSEGMWKARPVVASRIGGIQDQVVHEETGLLIDDPEDLEAYGRAVTRLLEDPEWARRLGEEAQRRVRDHFLGARHLMQYIDLLGRLLS